MLTHYSGLFWVITIWLLWGADPSNFYTC